jgi:hypothetical protein
VFSLSPAEAKSGTAPARLRALVGKTSWVATGAKRITLQCRIENCVLRKTRDNLQLPCGVREGRRLQLGEESENLTSKKQERRTQESACACMYTSRHVAKVFVSEWMDGGRAFRMEEMQSVIDVADRSADTASLCYVRL